MRRTSFFVIAIAAAALLPGQELVKVVTAKPGDKSVRLPGEIMPYERVDVVARVNGYVTKVLVDRGSTVRKGQLLIEMSAPEMAAQIAEAKSRVKTAESRKAEAEARLASLEAALERLKTASKTPGAIAGLELVQAEKAVDAGRAAVAAAADAVVSAKAAVSPLEDMEGYLKITAPFDSVVTERLVHPGALAGPAAGVLLKLENNSRLRLIVPVPESEAGAIPRGARITFTVPAHPGVMFDGMVARNPQSMDRKTRTLPVELEVANSKGLLTPGMYPEVAWPVGRRTGGALFAVPATAVVTTTERVFVIRAKADGTAEWVDVKKGAAQSPDQVQVAGPLSVGDSVVKRATDEIRPGTKLR
jgi:membrane fusion protein, multidrug efflux system